jgi:hypothetical protein
MTARANNSTAKHLRDHLRQGTAGQGFWSLTLYNDVHILQSQPLQALLAGDQEQEPQASTRTVSLTLYAGAKSPGKDKESNWLPAPEGTFSLYIRAYWAEPPSSTPPGSRRPSRWNAMK